MSKLSKASYHLGSKCGVYHLSINTYTSKLQFSLTSGNGEAYTHVWEKDFQYADILTILGELKTIAGSSVSMQSAVNVSSGYGDKKERLGVMAFGRDGLLVPYIEIQTADKNTRAPIVARFNFDLVSSNLVPTKDVGITLGDAGLKSFILWMEKTMPVMMQLFNTRGEKYDPSRPGKPRPIPEMATPLTGIPFTLRSMCKNYRGTLSSFGGRMDFAIWPNEQTAKSLHWKCLFNLLEATTLHMALDVVEGMENGGEVTLEVFSGRRDRREAVGSMVISKNERGTLCIEMQVRDRGTGELIRPKFGLYPGFSDLENVESKMDFGKMGKATLSYWLDTMLPIQMQLTNVNTNTPAGASYTKEPTHAPVHETSSEVSSDIIPF